MQKIVNSNLIVTTISDLSAHRILHFTRTLPISSDDITTLMILESSHFTDNKTETQKVIWISQGHKASE